MLKDCTGVKHFHKCSLETFRKEVELHQHAASHGLAPKILLVNEKYQWIQMTVLEKILQDVDDFGAKDFIQVIALFVKLGEIGIVHNDLCMRNLMYIDDSCQERRWYVIDFGLSRRTKDEEPYGPNPNLATLSPHLYTYLKNVAATHQLDFLPDQYMKKHDIKMPGSDQEAQLAKRLAELSVKAGKDLSKASKASKAKSSKSKAKSSKSNASKAKSSKSNASKPKIQCPKDFDRFLDAHYDHFPTTQHRTAATKLRNGTCDVDYHKLEHDDEYTPRGKIMGPIIVQLYARYMAQNAGFYPLMNSIVCEKLPNDEELRCPTSFKNLRSAAIKEVIRRATKFTTLNTEQVWVRCRIVGEIEVKVFMDGVNVDTADASIASLEASIQALRDEISD